MSKVQLKLLILPTFLLVLSIALIIYPSFVQTTTTQIRAATYFFSFVFFLFGTGTYIFLYIGFFNRDPLNPYVQHLAKLDIERYLLYEISILNDRAKRNIRMGTVFSLIGCVVLMAMPLLIFVYDRNRITDKNLHVLIAFNISTTVFFGNIWMVLFQ